MVIHFENSQTGRVSSEDTQPSDSRKIRPACTY